VAAADAARQAMGREKTRIEVRGGINTIIHRHGSFRYGGVTTFFYTHAQHRGNISATTRDRHAVVRRRKWYQLRIR
jgi:molybdopterin synthase catalytic subunit